MNLVTQVNVLNGEAMFTYEDGEQETINPVRFKQFMDLVAASTELPIDFLTYQRRLVYVANRHFN